MEPRTLAPLLGLLLALSAPVGAQEKAETESVEPSGAAAKEPEQDTKKDELVAYWLKKITASAQEAVGDPLSAVPQLAVMCWDIWDQENGRNSGGLVFGGRSATFRSGSAGRTPTCETDDICRTCNIALDDIAAKWNVFEQESKKVDPSWWEGGTPPADPKAAKQTILEVGKKLKDFWRAYNEGRKKLTAIHPPRDGCFGPPPHMADLLDKASKLKCSLCESMPKPQEG